MFYRMNVIIVLKVELVATTFQCRLCMSAEAAVGLNLAGLARFASCTSAAAEVWSINIYSSVGSDELSPNLARYHIT
jgi:hypothetical protein